MDMVLSRKFYLVLLLVVFTPLRHVHGIDCSASPTGDKADLEKHIELCQMEIEKDKSRLSSLQVQRTRTEADIQVIDYNLKKKASEIRQKDLSIYKLSSNIEKREKELAELQTELLSHIKIFEELMRKGNESERYRITDILLTNTSVSEFLSRIYQHHQVQEEIKILVAYIGQIKGKISSNIEILGGEKQQEEVLRLFKRTEKEEIEVGKKAKDRLLQSQLSTEKNISVDIKNKEKQIAKIRSRIFDLLGVGTNITFGKAVEYAKYAEQLTGVRAAFLLGLIKQETNIGKNVGTASWKVSMKSSRDTPIFFAITKLLGINPNEIKVSARQSGGWGGAMGPAQFIPSTWASYGGFRRISSNVCTDPAISRTSRIVIGTSSQDVLNLQRFLNNRGFKITSSGPGSKGYETNVFGSKTSKALGKFQEEYRKLLLTSSSDYSSLGEVGPKTAALINNLPCEEELRNGYTGWQYEKSGDRIRDVLQTGEPSNPWNPLHAFVASALYLKDLGAAKNGGNSEWCAALKYFQGPGSGCRARHNYNKHYPNAVTAHTKCFEYEIAFIENRNSGRDPCPSLHN